MTENGNAPIEELTEEQAQKLEMQIAVLSRMIASRIEFAERAGFQFQNKRDIYKKAGYKRKLEYEDYYGKYDRQDIAERIVEAPANETWREPPVIKDGDNETDFTKTWQRLISFEPDDISDKKSVWHYFNRLDKAAGIGRYALLVMGLAIPDLKEPDEEMLPEERQQFEASRKEFQQHPLARPLEPNSLSGPEDLLYLSIYSENDVGSIEVNDDLRSPRYNLPEFYMINTGSGEKTKQIKVHWSRVIHFADRLLTSDIEGRSRLKAVFNRLEDLEKILAATGEAGWNLLNKGIIATTKEGKKLPNDLSDIEADIEAYLHDLTKMLLLDGLEAKVEGGETVTPSDAVKTIISVISGATGIPQRILLGSEAAQLASSQDAGNWAKIISSRQTNIVEPGIIRPFINRLIHTGVLPKPISGNYTLEWPDLLKMTDKEEAETANQRADAMQKAAKVSASVLVSQEEIRGFGGLSPEPQGTTILDLIAEEEEELDE